MEVPSAILDLTMSTILIVFVTVVLKRVRVIHFGN
jgi:hypothetical protein